MSALRAAVCRLVSAFALAWAGAAVAQPRHANATNRPPAVHTGPVQAPAPGTVPPPATPPAQPKPTTPATPRAPGSPDQPRPAPPPVLVSRFGRFDLDTAVTQLARMPELRDCEAALAAPAGHADCALPASEDRLARVQLAWEDTRPGGELIALRLLFDPQSAPPLSELEFQLTRGWGPPVLEQLRRERDQKQFTLQWEDPEHRATLEAAGPVTQPSRAVAIVLERKPRVLQGELQSLRPRPFPGMRVRLARRLELEGQPHAVVWGTSLTPAQEALGEAGPAWATQRSYVGLWRLEPPTGSRPRRWKPLWERVAGDEDEDQQRILRVDTRDVTGDGTPDLEVELSCFTCGSTATEVSIKTVRAGKVIDLLAKRDLYRAQVELGVGQLRIREPEGEDGTTVSTYAYDRSRGAFVLAREERVGAPH